MRALTTATILALIMLSQVSAWTGECVGVSDGDTITVMHGDTAEKIRLHGIDCPEKKQPFGRRAKRFTNAMVFRQMVNVEPLTKDRYGRTIAWISIAGKSLNYELVKAGMA